jgi:hypothetical protein
MRWEAVRPGGPSLTQSLRLSIHSDFPMTLLLGASQEDTCKKRSSRIIFIAGRPRVESKSLHHGSAPTREGQAALIRGRAAARPCYANANSLLQGKEGAGDWEFWGQYTFPDLIFKGCYLCS